MGYGFFSGNPHTEWLADSGSETQMRLLSDFSYTAPDGQVWLAPAGSVIDGASIPRSLWSAVGSPYTGHYRRASIVHDIACDNLSIARATSDTMFYFACLAGGCSLADAKLLYAGVRIGAWADAYTPFMADPVLIHGAQRLPGEHTPDELTLRARYTVLADELKQTPDDFAAIKAVADRHLGP